MARVVIHIGTHKTGTTALQDAFHANRDLLARHGVIYPQIGPHSGHHGLLTDWIRLPAAYHGPDGGMAGLRALADIWRDRDVTLVLSSEEFSRGGGPGGCVDMAALRAIFDGWDTVQVICLLRSQWQFLQSVYLEIARSRPPLAPHTLVDGALRSGMADGLWCDYTRLLAHLRAGFAPQEICLLSFDRVMLRPDAVVGAVLDLLGVDLPADDRCRIVTYRANRSPDPIPTWAAFVIAAGHMPSDALRSATRTAWDLEFGPNRRSCLFTRREIDALQARFVPDNDRLASDAASGLADALPWRGPGPDTVFRDDLDAAFWTRVARRIYFDGAGDGTGPTAQAVRPATRAVGA